MYIYVARNAEGFHCIDLVVTVIRHQEGRRGVVGASATREDAAVWLTRSHCPDLLALAS